MNFLKFIFSFVYPISVEKTSSEFNPLLEVNIENGKYVLNAANANYSFGSLHKIFLKTFRHVKIGKGNIKNVLLLGFGGGSVSSLLFEEFHLNCKITAVEIDEKVIDLAKKYFDTGRFQNLDLICADAFEFVKRCNSKYDLIVVDIFIDDKVPSQFETAEFCLALKKLMNDKGILLFNEIIDAEKESGSFEKFQKTFSTVFEKHDVFYVLGNAVLIAET